MVEGTFLFSGWMLELCGDYKGLCFGEPRGRSLPEVMICLESLVLPNDLLLIGEEVIFKVGVYSSAAQLLHLTLPYLLVNW